MMRAAIYARAMLVTLCTLLALATSASAECAWVMWAAEVGSRDQPWSVYTDGFSTRADCMQEKTKHGGDTLKIPLKNGTFITVVLRCLPDTVDPRGPKGSGR